jgi:hypothetical protein
MPTIPAGYIEATFLFQVTGSARTMTWSCGFDDAEFEVTPPDTEAANIRSNFVGTGKPYLAANMATGWSFLGVNITKQLEDGPIIGSSLSTVAGTLSGSSCPNNCANLLNKITGTGGRRGRGRAFIPPLHFAETVVDSAGFIPSGTVAGVLAFYTAAFTACVGQGYTPVLFHATAPFTPSPITGWTMSTQMATQRRRMRK